MQQALNSQNNLTFFSQFVIDFQNIPKLHFQTYALYIHHAYHMIRTVLGFLVDVQTLLPGHLIAQNLEGLVHHLECQLGSVHVVRILIGMHQHGETAILFLDLVGSGIWLELQHLERVEIEICGAGTKQTCDLLFVG